MWQYLVVFLLSVAVNYLLAPRPIAISPEKQDAEKPSTLNEGDPIPLVYGKKRVVCKVIWYGDLRVIAIRKKGSKK